MFTPEQRTEFTVLQEKAAKHKKKMQKATAEATKLYLDAYPHMKAVPTARYKAGCVYKQAWSCYGGGGVDIETITSNWVDNKDDCLKWIEEMRKEYDEILDWFWYDSEIHEMTVKENGGFVVDFIKELNHYFNYDPKVIHK